MSNGRLIFSFKNGINLALNEEEVAQGAIIDFDLDFEQVKMEYEGHLFSVVSPNEVEGLKPVLRFKSKESDTGGKKRKHEDDKEETWENNEPTGGIGQMRSMVLTTAGELISAPMDQILTSPLRKAPLTRSRRRAASRRKRRTLEQLTRMQTEEATPRSVPFQVTTERQMLPDPEYVEYDTPREECIIYPIIQRSEEHPDVEPYIPQFVQPGRLQIISEEELAMFQKVRKQDFEHFERIRGRYVNILEGLELHTDVFSENEQSKIVKYVLELKGRGREGLLMKKTYSEPRKWMKGKGRVTIQFGCCYNYARDKEGNPPGIIRREEVDPLPPLMKMMIRRMVEWHVLPADSVPDSCIVNVYEEGDCIPPHIDSHDFLRPFCTVSLLSECNIMFGKEIRVVGPSEFRGSTEIPLPVGSVLVLKGNGADLAKHCVPGVPQRRISITFRKMDYDKMPFGYQPDPELEGLRPLEL